MWSDPADFPQQIYIFFAGRFCSSNDEIEGSCFDEPQHGPIVRCMHNVPFFSAQNTTQRRAHLGHGINYECRPKGNELSL